uniref:Gnk2-homologous domain-containing protein n=1 Tax=Ananas comosus var. bracteatus TaxID=296719 RepID=A0A6V7P6S7_ANACO|nr:unnamed protein product [Ananas comosus var. bracteatus]
MSGSSLTFLLSFFTLLSIAIAAADNNNTTGYNTFVYSGCSPQHYTSGSSYESYVDSILASISAAAAASSFANFTSPGAVSGLYKCLADLPATACASCVRSALSQLASLCPSAAGAAVQLRACFLRYGNDSFLGKPDTSLLFKKCGAAIGAGIGGGGDVDAALEAVTEGGGEYRVGGAGRVQAVAQCVGDLIAEECGECVKAAVEQLESECGAAAEEGEAYLGKCYVRYWSDEEGGGGGGSGGGSGIGGGGSGGGGGGGGIGGGGIGGGGIGGGGIGGGGGGIGGGGIGGGGIGGGGGGIGGGSGIGGGGIGGGGIGGGGIGGGGGGIGGGGGGGIGGGGSGIGGGIGGGGGHDGKRSIAKNKIFHNFQIFLSFLKKRNKGTQELMVPLARLGDQSEKIAAIIVGIIVGIALLIGFFSFIRRAGRGK